MGHGAREFSERISLFEGVHGLVNLLSRQFEGESSFNPEQEIISSDTCPGSLRQRVFKVKYDPI